MDENQNNLHPSQLQGILISRSRSKSIYFISIITTTLLIGFTATVPNYLKRYKPYLFGSGLILMVIGSNARKEYESLNKLIDNADKVAQFNYLNWFKNRTSTTAKLAITPESNDDWQPDNLININDLAAKLSKLHGRIIGSTGSGKSILTKALVRLIEGNLKIYDVEATNKDWKGFEIVGRGENWQSISDSMASDLKLFKQRVGEATDINNDAGWDLFKGRTEIRIVEEYPDAKDEINSLSKPLTTKSDYKGLADEWCQKLARRGRKPGILLLLISQYDGVSSWGFEGKGNLVNCFHAIRLGEFAIAHAKKLNDEQLVKWLKQDLTSRCMVDNLPCQLPDRSTQIVIGNGIAEAEKDNTDIELNELESAIIEVARRLNGDKLTASNVKQQSRLFRDISTDDIRIIFQSLADKNIGTTTGEGNKLSYLKK